MSKNQIAKNTIYNMLLIVVNTAYPLITAAYISETLGAENIGLVNLGQTFVRWFIIMTGLGLTTYGVREVAKAKDNPKKLNEITTNILVLNLISVAIGMGIYIILIIFNNDLNVHFDIYVVYLIQLAISAVSFEWLYTGLEMFQFIAIRSIIVKIISILFLFIFVNDSKDYVIYALITIFGLTANGLLNWVGLKKYIRFDFSNLELKSILYQTRFFYFQNIVGSIYTVINQLILGFTVGAISLAFFTRANQFVGIVMSLILSLSATLIPTLSYEYNKNQKKYRELVDFNYRLILFLSIPAIGGIITLGDKIMYLFGGNEFVDATPIFSVLSLTIIITGLSVFINTQLAVPAGKEKNTFYANIGVAIVTLLLTIFLIPIMGAVGVAVALIIGELTGVIIQSILAKKTNLYLGFFTWKSIKYFIATIIMMLAIIITNTISSNLFLSLISSVFIGMSVYMISIYLLSILIRDEINDTKFIFEKIIKR
ncbi:MAG: flippase [Culicoidibacterales bacterium]